MNDLSKVIEESEKFLRENEGAERCRIVNVIEFTDIVTQNDLAEKVKVRDFKIDGTPLTQAYVELNGEYVYATVIQ